MGLYNSLGCSVIAAIPDDIKIDRSAKSWRGYSYTPTVGNDYFAVGISYTKPPSWKAVGVGPSVSFLKKISSLKPVFTTYL
jgi:hypothetical protein